MKQGHSYGHMWWNIAASQGDEDAAENRDIIAKKMTPADISAAQNLARECVRKTIGGVEFLTSSISIVYE